MFVCDDFSWENVWKDACHDVNNNCGWRWDLSDCFLFVYLYFSKISNIIVCQLFNLDGVSDFKNSVEKIVTSLCGKNLGFGDRRYL